MKNLYIPSFHEFDTLFFYIWHINQAKAVAILLSTVDCKNDSLY